MDGEPQTKVIGGNPHIAKALAIESCQGWQDQLCDQYLDGYKLIKKLGQGGMGSVYMAEQMSLRRMVALKMLNPMLARNRAFLDRFISEAKAAAQVNHRNLVQIFDVGESNGVYYFSMEYVDGENAGQVLDRMTVMPHDIALDLVIPIVSSLSAAHAANIIHRDVKPDNIMIDTTGIPKLADLGIAKVEGVAAMPEGRRTESGAQLGTPHYVSPEQARNPTDVDGRADVYSLGATLFHMVTGRPPYEGNNPAVILRKLATEPVPIASELNDKVPYALSNVISRMMAKMPHERYSGPEELYQVLVDLRNNQQTKTTTGTQRVLTDNQQMRIEAPTDEAPLELHLEGEDPNDDSALYNNYKPKVARPGRPAGAPAAAVTNPDEFVPAVTRPKGPRPDSASMNAVGGPMARPPRPGSAPAESSQQPPMNLIIGGAVGLILVVVGGLFALSGPSNGSSDSGDDSGGGTEVGDTNNSGTTGPVTTTSGTSGTTGAPVETAAERHQRRAREQYEKWSSTNIRGLADAELTAMAAALGKIVKEYKGTPAADDADFLLKNSVKKEQEKREYKALAAAVEKLIQAKEWAKALKTIDDFVKAKPEHTRMAAITSDREKLLVAANAAYDELKKKILGMLEKDGHVEAKDELGGARPRQLKHNQAKIDEDLELVASAKVLHKRLVELERYPPYWIKIQAVMTAKRSGGKPPGDLEGALKKAEELFTGEMLGVHSAEVELADLKAVIAGRDAAMAALNASFDKKETITLSFVKRDKLEEKTGQLRDKVDPNKQVISMTTTYKRFHELSMASLAKLGGDKYSGADGSMALALYLTALKRDSEASKAMAAGKRGDPDRYRRHLLRFLSAKLVVVRNLAGTEKPSEPVKIRVMAEAYGVRSLGIGTPYEAALKEMGNRLIKDNLVNPGVVMRTIDVERKNKRYTIARALCKVVMEYYLGRANERFRKAAKQKLDGMVGK